MWSSLTAQADDQFEKEGVPKDHVIYHFIADMRYVGQEHTVKVNVPPLPWSEATKDEIVRCFHETHEHFYTYSLKDTPTEIVNLHLVACGRLDKPELAWIEPQRDLWMTLFLRRGLYFTEDGWMETPVYAREKAGQRCVF